MEINDYIRVYDNCIDYKTLSVFLRYTNTLSFKPAGVGPKNTTNMNIRNTYLYPLDNNKKSLSDAHWHNYFIKILNDVAIDYQRFIGNGDCEIRAFETINLLKYNEGGFYKRHVDHFPAMPRTLSFIFLLNNDYKDGDIVFKLKKGDLKIENKPNRIIVWPSTFMYPHEIKPVKEGIRYSLVTWAL